MTTAEQRLVEELYEASRDDKMPVIPEDVFILLGETSIDPEIVSDAEKNVFGHEFKL